eukprot:scaffold124987_cov66-Phaeocystis_antarctica.AAC.1
MGRATWGAPWGHAWGVPRAAAIAAASTPNNAVLSAPNNAVLCAAIPSAPAKAVLSTAAVLPKIIPGGSSASIEPRRGNPPFSWDRWCSVGTQTRPRCMQRRHSSFSALRSHLTLARPQLVHACLTVVTTSSHG